MLQIEELQKKYFKKTGKVQALSGVSFSMKENEVLALLGESGSGKSTLGELIIGLQEPTSGRITWHGENIANVIKKNDLQYIFQNPDRSLNPHWTIEHILLEPFLLQKVKRKYALTKVKRILKTIELPTHILSRYPHQCSGGQKQRVAIGRALALQPKLLIADEVTSSLDPVTEQVIIHLLKEIRQEHQMAILYITHRIHTIEGFAENMIVLKDGKIIEKGAVEQTLNGPRTDYTQALLKASNYGPFPQWLSLE